MAILLVVVAVFSGLTAYENGYFESPPLEGQSAGQNRASGTSPDADPATTSQADLERNPLSLPTLLTESEPNQELYNSLSDSERGSLQRIADAVDATFKGQLYREGLTDEDLQLAEQYDSLINQERWREFWYRTARKTGGFPRFQKLRDQGNPDDFKSAAIAWIRLDGFTRGMALEILQALTDGNEEFLNEHRDILEQHPLLFDIEHSAAPLRAPKPGV